MKLRNGINNHFEKTDGLRIEQSSEIIRQRRTLGLTAGLIFLGVQDTVKIKEQDIFIAFFSSSVKLGNNTTCMLMENSGIQEFSQEFYNRPFESDKIPQPNPLGFAKFPG